MDDIRVEMIDTTEVGVKRVSEKEVRILILEDLSSDAILLQRELRRAQFHFTARVVQTREDFLDQLRRFSPEIILSDYVMPAFDGMQALRLTQELAPSVPFILVTGSINEETAVECMKAGATDYILKERLARLGPAIISAMEQRSIREEKERAERRLVQSEQRFRSLIENSSDVVTIINHDGIVRYISPSVNRILALDPSDIVGRHIRRYVHSEDLLLVSETFELLSSRPQDVRTIECRLAHQDGSWRTVEAVGKSLIEESGTTGIVVNFRDVTERKQMEAALRDSETRYRLLFDINPEPMWVFDRSSLRFLAVNQEAVEHYGYTHDEFAQMNVHDICSASDAESFLGMLERSTLTKESPRTWKHRRKDGSMFDVEITSHEIIFGDRPACIVVARDVTERKRMMEALRESEERYRRLVELSPDTIFVQRDDRIVYVNPAGLKLLGAQRHEQLVGKSLLEIVHPQYRPLVREQINKLKEEQTEIPLIQEKLLRLDDSVVDVEVAAASFTDHDQPAAQIIARDITERRRAEEQLKRSHQQLRALAAHLQSIREEERTRIAREIHDELGQELTALKMDLTALSHRIAKLDLKTIGPILERAQVMSELIDSTIQTIRRISTELRPGILDDLGLDAAIEWQAQEFQKRTGIECHWIGFKENFTIGREHSTAIFRICQEALTNVARHAQATELTISLRRGDGCLVLEVRDNGRGITQREIGDPKSLGLLGMKERAAVIGGELSIDGVSDGGTTVTVRIPFRE